MASASFQAEAEGLKALNGTGLAQRPLALSPVKQGPCLLKPAPWGLQQGLQQGLRVFACPAGEV